MCLASGFAGENRAKRREIRRIELRRFMFDQFEFDEELMLNCKYFIYEICEAFDLLSINFEFANFIIIYV